MSQSMTIVLTVIGDDRAGVVEQIATAIAEHGGSWRESHMARVAGKFAGIARVEIPSGQAQALGRALDELTGSGLHVVMETSVGEPPLGERHLDLELLGPDRDGIVREISHTLATRGISVVELETSCTNAPMSGELLFRARAALRAPTEVAIDELREALETIASDLMVDIELREE